MAKNNKIVTWLIIGGEELPLAVVRAKTEQGAVNLFRACSGNACELIHAEEVTFDKYGYYGMTTLR